MVYVISLLKGYKQGVKNNPMHFSNIANNCDDCIQNQYKYYYANFYHSDIGNAMEEVKKEGLFRVVK